VERLLQIRSDPPEAQVMINGENAGTTPLDHPFTFYGTFDVTLRAKGHRSLRVLEPVSMPWYEVFPLDFFAEHLCPLTLHDRHVLEYKLAKVPLEEREVEREEKAVLGRLEALERRLDPPVAAPQAKTP
jgi:hypothetical protein